MPFSVPIDDICLLSEWKCIVAIRVLVNDDASNEFSCVCETVRWKTWSRWAISASLLAKTWCRHVTSSYLAKKQIGKRFMSVFITMPSIQITFTCSALVLSLSILPCTFGGFVQNISSFFFVESHMWHMLSSTSYATLIFHSTKKRGAFLASEQKSLSFFSLVVLM